MTDGNAVFARWSALVSRSSRSAFAVTRVHIARLHADSGEDIAVRRERMDHRMTTRTCDDVPLAPAIDILIFRSRDRVLHAIESGQTS